MMTLIIVYECNSQNLQKQTPKKFQTGAHTQSWIPLWVHSISYLGLFAEVSKYFKAVEYTSEDKGVTKPKEIKVWSTTHIYVCEDFNQMDD